MIGTINTGRIIDRIGENLTALQREFDTPILCRTQIATFRHHLATQRISIDPNRIIGAVAHVSMRFVRCLDIGSDTAVVKQIDWCLQNLMQ